MHNGAPHDLDLPLADEAAVESRANGVNPSIRFAFSAPIEALSGTIGCAHVKVTGGTCTSVSASGNTLSLTLNSNFNACTRVVLSGIGGVDSGLPVFGDNDVELRLIPGDVDGSGIVNLLDLQAIKNTLFQPVGPSNFRSDVNLDGLINLEDMQFVKNALFQSAACP
jgi:hypothetical protein